MAELGFALVEGKMAKPDPDRGMRLLTAALDKASTRVAIFFFMVSVSLST